MFNWNVVAPGWQMDIQKSTIHITLPKPSGKVQCTSSFDGTGPCTIEGAGTDSVTVSTGPLAPRTPVTVRIGLPTAAAGPRHRAVAHRVRPGARTQPPRRRGVLGAIALAALAIGYALDRRSREPEPGYPVMYEPPKGLGPVQTAYITTEAVPSRALVATLLYQAEQGLTKLTENGSKSWTITGIGDEKAWAATDDVTRYRGRGTRRHQPGGTFKSSGILGHRRARHCRPSRTDSTAPPPPGPAGIGASRTSSSEWLARVAVVVAGIATAVMAIFIQPPVSACTSCRSPRS